MKFQKIYIPSTRRKLEILDGWWVREITKLLSLYRRKMEVPGDRGCIYEFPLCWGMDTFWNYTFSIKTFEVMSFFIILGELLKFFVGSKNYFSLKILPMFLLLLIELEEIIYKLISLLIRWCLCCSHMKQHSKRLKKPLK